MHLLCPEYFFLSSPFWILLFILIIDLDLESILEKINSGTSVNVVSAASTNAQGIYMVNHHW